MDTKAMPMYGNFSPVLVFDLHDTRIDLRVIKHDVVMFQRDLDDKTRDIVDFVDIGRFIEMKIKHSLQPDSRKLKSCYYTFVLCIAAFNA